MSIYNTEQSYGWLAKTFHWTVGILIIALLIVGLTMVRMQPSPKMFQIYGLHKSIGLLVLMLATLRILWRLANTYVLSLPNHHNWEKFLARLVHGLLYVAMFLMPLSGWIMSSAHGYSVSFFGLFTMPDFVPHSDELSNTAATVHNISAYMLIGVIGLHVAGALKHFIIDRDRTLQRMLPGTN